jgi:hypothetical protein
MVVMVLWSSYYFFFFQNIDLGPGFNGRREDEEYYLSMH